MQIDRIIRMNCLGLGHIEQMIPFPALFGHALTDP
jgi:hypothetical protein